MDSGFSDFNRGFIDEGILKSQLATISNLGKEQIRIVKNNT